MGVWVKITDKKSWQNVFQIMLNDVLKTCEWNSDNSNNKKWKNWWLYLINFGIPSSLVLFIKNWGVRRGFINRQNLLSKTGVIFFNWDSLHARLNSHYKVWSYKKKNSKMIKACMNSFLKEPTVNRHFLILDLKPFRL